VMDSMSISARVSSPSCIVVMRARGRRRQKKTLRPEESG
jgi:hypothetical protein